MAGKRVHNLIRDQHGVISRRQLLELGISAAAIDHRVAQGRLFPVFAGVYAAGRPAIDRWGRWMAATLSCGSHSVLSHGSAAAALGIGLPERALEVTVPRKTRRRRPGIVVHRRDLAVWEVTRRHGIPVTKPATTLVDIAARASRAQLELAVGEADKLDLIHPDRLRETLDRLGIRRGVRQLRALLDQHGYVPTHTELERRFLPVARGAGLPSPQTQVWVNGFRVDFFWPELGLVVEADSLRYHRTKEQQANDRVRDQRHVAAGLTCLRFTWLQVTRQQDYVRATLAAVRARLTSAA